MFRHSRNWWLSWVVAEGCTVLEQPLEQNSEACVSCPYSIMEDNDLHPAGSASNAVEAWKSQHYSPLPK